VKQKVVQSGKDLVCSVFAVWCMCRVGQNHIVIRIYMVYIRYFLLGNHGHV